MFTHSFEVVLKFLIIVVVNLIVTFADKSKSNAVNLKRNKYKIGIHYRYMTWTSVLNIELKWGSNQPVQEVQFYLSCYFK